MKRLIYLLLLIPFTATAEINFYEWASSPRSLGGNFYEMFAGDTPSGYELSYDYDFAPHGGDENVYTLDLSPNDRTATVSGSGGSITFVPAENGLSSHYFSSLVDGDRGYTVGGTNSTTYAHGASNFAASVWVKLPSGHDNFDGVICASTGNYDNKILTGTTIEKRLIWLATESGGSGNSACGIDTQDGVYEFNKWVNFAVTASTDGSVWTLKTYIDGLLSNSRFITNNYTIGQQSAFELFNDPSSSAGRFNGSMAFPQQMVPDLASGLWDADAMKDKHVTEGAKLGIISDYLADNTNTYWNDTETFLGLNNTYRDGSTNGVTFTSASVPALVGTTQEGWADFNGVANFLQSDSITILNGVTQLTAIVWTVADVKKANTTLIANRSSSDYLLLQQGNGTDDFVVRLNVTGSASPMNADTTGNILVTNEWMSLVMTWTSGDALKFYKDGVLVSEDNTDVTGTFVVNDEFFIGTDEFDSANREWDGYIDEVYLLSTALSSNQVYNYHHSTTNTHSNP